MDFTIFLEYMNLKFNDKHKAKISIIVEINLNKFLFKAIYIFFNDFLKLIGSNIILYLELSMVTIFYL